jgi:hypothetical protein
LAYSFSSVTQAQGNVRISALDGLWAAAQKLSAPPICPDPPNRRILTCCLAIGSSGSASDRKWDFTLCAQTRKLYSATFAQEADRIIRRRPRAPDDARQAALLYEDDLHPIGDRRDRRGEPAPEARKDFVFVMKRRDQR